MAMALSMAQLHSLGQHDQNYMQHDIFGHVMPLPLATALTDGNGAVNGIIPFLKSR